MSTSSLTGKSWQSWPAQDEPGDETPVSGASSTSGTTSGSSSGTNTPIGIPSSPSQSPVLPRRHSSSDDVMKLPKRDMKVFGECPVQDDFLLAVCDLCHRCVKVEAFQQHYRIRHGGAGPLGGGYEAPISIGSRRGKSSKKSSTRAATVDLFPMSSSSSAGTTENSAPPTLASSPVAVKEEEEPMDEGGVSPPSSSPSITPVPPVEEADSTTNSNVISIPDTDPLPLSMSNDLMAMVSGDIKVEGQQAAAASSSPSEGIQISPHSVIKLQLNPPPPPPSFPAHMDVKKGGGISGGSPSKRNSGGSVSGGKVQREYHPDKHCGVWDNDSKRHCTRALTCKSHSVLLKRKIPGRSKSFDELVKMQKAQKEAQMAAAAAQQQQPTPQLQPQRRPASMTTSAVAESVLVSITEPNPIDPRFTIPNGRAKYVSPNTKLTAVSTNGLGTKKALLSLASADENLHYTTDHPKPLAVCTFGGRRVGGLLVTDRSQFLTRKVVRVAITAGGFHRIRPQNRLNEIKFGNSGGSVIRRAGGIGGGGAIVSNARIPTVVTTPTAAVVGGGSAGGGSYLVNYNLAPAATTGGSGGPRLINAVAAASPVSASPQINLSSLPPGTSVTAGLPINIAAASEGSFKTDIQDFKGGIKFELGTRKIKILPSNSEVSK